MNELFKSIARGLIYLVVCAVLAVFWTVIGVYIAVMAVWVGLIMLGVQVYYWAFGDVDISRPRPYNSGC